MIISAKSVRFDHHIMWVDLSDERIIGVPLSWFPRLRDASLEQLKNYELSPRGIHWDTLDEDVSIEALLKGYGDITHPPHQVA